MSLKKASSRLINIALAGVCGLLVSCQNSAPAARELNLKDSQVETNLGQILVGVSEHVAAARQANVLVGGQRVVEAELSVAAQYLPAVGAERLGEIKERIAKMLAAKEGVFLDSYSLMKQQAERTVAERSQLLKERDLLHAKLVAEQKAHEEKIKNDAGLRRFTSLAFSGLGAAALVMATFALVYFRQLAAPLGIIGTVFISLGQVTAILQPWMIGTAAALVLGSCGLAMYFSLREKTVADGSVGLIQEFRNDNPDVWKNDLKARATEWLGTANSGIAKFIDEKARALNVK